MYLQLPISLQFYAMRVEMPGKLDSHLAYFTKKVSPCLDKPPLNFNGSLAKLGLTSLVGVKRYTMYRDISGYNDQDTYRDAEKSFKRDDG